MSDAPCTIYFPASNFLPYVQYPYFLNTIQNFSEIISDATEYNTDKQEVCLLFF